MSRPRQVTNEQILAVAREVFLQHGSGAAVSVVAGRLGVSDAALFKRFGTKEGLLMAALSPPAVLGFVPLADAGPTAGDLREQLVELTQSITESLARIVPCMNALRASGIDPAVVLAQYEVPPPLVGRRALVGWFERAIAAGRLRADCDPQSTAMLIMGAVHLQTFLVHVIAGAAGASPEEPSDYGARIVETLWRGISPGSEGGSK